MESMVKPHVISALVKMRGDLAGRLAAHDRKRRAIADQLAHVDHVLIMFGHEGDSKDIPAKRKQTLRIAADDEASMLRW